MRDTRMLFIILLNSIEQKWYEKQHAWMRTGKNMHIILFVLRNAIGIEEWHGIFSFGFMTYNLIFLPFE